MVQSAWNLTGHNAWRSIWVKRSDDMLAKIFIHDTRPMSFVVDLNQFNKQNIFETKEFRLFQMNHNLKGCC